MSQRDSGYARKERDLYETPEWVTEALFEHMPGFATVWEPACGNGKMVRALEKNARVVKATDITTGDDFLQFDEPLDVYSIVTNPPYEFAAQFVEKSVHFLKSHVWFVAMLLRTDFDHASGRRHLFRDCPQFAKKVVLTRRIRWFEDSRGSPSFNHAWFIWAKHHNGPPTLAYGP